MATKSVKSRGQNVSKTALVDIFGVTPPTVDGWLRAGCPIVEKGSRGMQSTFNTADVAKWLRETAREEGSGTVKADEAELNRRKLLAQTCKAELELAIAKGDVAPIREFERAQSMMMAAIRANMRNVPSRAVLQLLGCNDEVEFKTQLMREIDLALVTAAEADIDNVDADEVDEV